MTSTAPQRTPMTERTGQIIIALLVLVVALLVLGSGPIVVIGALVAAGAALLFAIAWLADAALPGQRGNDDPQV